MDLQSMLGEAILSANSDAIIAADKEGIIVSGIPAQNGSSAIRTRTPWGDHWILSFHRRCENAIGTDFIRVMQSGDSRYDHGDILAVPGLTKDGKRISIEFTIIPLRIQARELMGLAAIMRDVTKRFEETRALKQRLAEATK